MLEGREGSILLQLRQSMSDVARVASGPALPAIQETLVQGRSLESSALDAIQEALAQGVDGPDALLAVRESIVQAGVGDDEVVQLLADIESGIMDDGNLHAMQDRLGVPRS